MSLALNPKFWLFQHFSQILGGFNKVSTLAKLGLQNLPSLLDFSIPILFPTPIRQLSGKPCAVLLCTCQVQLLAKSCEKSHPDFGVLHSYPVELPFYSCSALPNLIISSVPKCGFCLFILSGHGLQSPMQSWRNQPYAENRVKMGLTL